MSPKLLVFVCMLFVFVFTDSAQAQSRKMRRNDFGIEVLGKALFYNFSYQRMVTPSLGVQMGASLLPGRDASYYGFPLGGKFYLSPKNGSFFITGGVVFMEGEFFSVLPEGNKYNYVGVGVEYRSENDWLFRGIGYHLFSSEGGSLFPGVHVGYAF